MSEQNTIKIKGHCDRCDKYSDNLIYDGERYDYLCSKCCKRLNEIFEQDMIKDAEYRDSLRNNFEVDHFTLKEYEL